MTLRLSIVLSLLVALAFVFSAPAQSGQDIATKQIDATLTALHEAASKADGNRYFDLFASDAVFLGTDETERWPIDAFKTYAMKRFETGTGWTYTLKPGTRHIIVDGNIAWFDELLENAKYGTTRGSGVLRKVGDQWKIAQYNLTFTVPNDSAASVVNVIQQGELKPTTIYLVRHAEKDTSNPRDPDPDLSDAGRQRAALLQRMLKDVKIDHVIVSHMKRTQQTVEGIVSANLQPEVLNPQGEQTLPARLRNDLRGKTVLICGHSNTVPMILKSLGVQEPITMNEDEYDRLFIVTIIGDRMSLQQLRYGD